MDSPGSSAQHKDQILRSYHTQNNVYGYPSACGNMVAPLKFNFQYSPEKKQGPYVCFDIASAARMHLRVFFPECGSRFLDISLDSPRSGASI